MSSKALQIELLLKCCCVAKWDFIKLKKWQIAGCSRNFPLVLVICAMDYALFFFF